jgi:ATP/maltotriose-dependent transcriptional regulator MalT
MAAVHLARGETALATDLLERALAQNEPDSTAAAALLSLLVDVHLATGDLDQAEMAADKLATCAARHRSHYLTAAAALARGRVQFASGTGDPQAFLRDALAGFAKAQTPMELAHSRLALAHAMQTVRPEVALAEARAALAGFERLQAARQADAAAALLRALGVKPAAPAKAGGVLTKRESDVLELLGQGLSNPEISERLYISRKTVEHHVGNILAKLGLRGRAEAAAYAARTSAAKPAPG